MTFEKFKRKLSKHVTIKMMPLKRLRTYHYNKTVVGLHFPLSNQIWIAEKQHPIILFHEAIHWIRKIADERLGESAVEAIAWAGAVFLCQTFCLDIPKKIYDKYANYWFDRAHEDMYNLFWIRDQGHLAANNLLMLLKGKTHEY